MEIKSRILKIASTWIITVSSIMFFLIEAFIQKTILKEIIWNVAFDYLKYKFDPNGKWESAFFASITLKAGLWILTFLIVLVIYKIFFKEDKENQTKAATKKPIKNVGFSNSERLTTFINGVLIGILMMFIIQKPPQEDSPRIVQLKKYLSEGNEDITRINKRNEDKKILFSLRKPWEEKIKNYLGEPCASDFMANGAEGYIVVDDCSVHKISSGSAVASLRGFPPRVLLTS